MTNTPKNSISLLLILFIIQCKVNSMAGLVLIDSDNNICLLHRRKPYYNSRLVIEDCELPFHSMNNYNNKETRLATSFVEKYQLPRGAMNDENETSIHTALREFIEETNQLPINNLMLLKYYFLLRWDDNGKEWKYKIFFGHTTSTFKQINKYKSNDDNMKINTTKFERIYKQLVKSKKLDSTDLYDRMNIEKNNENYNNILSFYCSNKNNRKIKIENKHRRVIYCQVNDYISYMQLNQLKCYKSSNYNDFILLLIEFCLLFK